MKITDKIELQVIEDNIGKLSKQLDTMQPIFIQEEQKADGLNAELEHWLKLRKGWYDANG